MSAKPPIISVNNVTKRFGDVAAVDDVSLTIEEGEFFALLGPSGCGKTTLLRMLAGFETPTAGHITIDGKDVIGVPPNRRPVNMVFQSYAVFPHMTVADNIGYGLKMDGLGKAERAARVEEALSLVRLDGFADRKPDQMSGGQRQRVALARALAKRPRVLLLDEPLSALDAKLREAMRFELASLQHHVGITFVMVTHDQDEALAMATRCAVMERGRLIQLATPSDLYEFPNSKFVADFIGSVNMVEGKLASDKRDEAVIATRELGAVFVDHAVLGNQGATLWLALRPEKIEMRKRDGTAAAPVMEDAPPGYNVVAGKIDHIAYLGSESVFEVVLDGGGKLRVIRPNLTRWDQEDFVEEEPVWLSWHACAPAVLAG